MIHVSSSVHVTPPAETELATDAEMLGAAATRSIAAFRVWRTDSPAVVVGKAVEVEREVDVDYCRESGTAIVRRDSGGRSVWIGPGTLQYAFALPYALSPELGGIASAKRFCNRLLLDAFDPAHAVTEDVSGDLVVGANKVGGLALRRVRSAMLLHGTILVGADLEIIARALRHPEKEPAYRRGRPHCEFLANLSPLDAVALARSVGDSLARLVEAGELRLRELPTP